jgi:hypothetical protein
MFFPLSMRLMGTRAEAERLISASSAELQHSAWGAERAEGVENGERRRCLLRGVIHTARTLQGTRRPQVPSELCVLTFEQRAAVALFELEELPEADVADALDTLVENVRRLRQTARTALMYGGQSDPELAIARWRESTTNVTPPISDDEAAARAELGRSEPLRNFVTSEVPSSRPVRTSVTFTGNSAAQSTQLWTRAGVLPSWLRPVLVGGASAMVALVAAVVVLSMRLEQLGRSAQPSGHGSSAPLSQPTAPFVSPSASGSPPASRGARASSADAPAPNGMPGAAHDGGTEPAEASTAMSARLTNDEVMAVVLAHRSELMQCARQQRKRSPGSSGKLVMRWRVRTSGRAEDVRVATSKFEGSVIAKCVENNISKWTFPKHRVERDPIEVPIRF